MPQQGRLLLQPCQAAVLLQPDGLFGLLQQHEQRLRAHAGAASHLHPRIVAHPAVETLGSDGAASKCTDL